MDTFQGIPWFSSPEEAVQQLIDLGFIDEVSTKVKNGIEKINKAEGSFIESQIAINNDNKKVPYQFDGSKDFESLTKKLQALTIGIVSRTEILKTIAKQELINFRLLFTADPKTPQLVELVLIFAERNTSVYEALIASYGEPDATGIMGDHIWLGENNTIIIQSRNGKIVAFASIDGLTLAESINVPTLQTEPKEDTGF